MHTEDSLRAMNFWMVGHRGCGDDPGCHIGKRAVGPGYCWDCRLPLCIDGLKGYFRGTGIPRSRCPECNKPQDESALQLQTPKREGVTYCHIFLWAVHPNHFIHQAQDGKFRATGEQVQKGKVAEDDQGRKYTLEEMLAIMEECPIQHLHTGKRFS
jgi:hypothetical protein